MKIKNSNLEYYVLLTDMSNNDELIKYNVLHWTAEYVKNKIKKKQIYNRGTLKEELRCEYKV